ncbi:hypothetical protein CV102_04865 [Natronococcus pandeyae]|uniref:Uncharacterized protein n=1 Tax=Natronococcus pandeyae TaxID=2055836 RepID=A0A8J8TT95_9EURY|nr:hypothetical protein CV102_04865 [Natronococcus pandeyae]
MDPMYRRLDRADATVGRLSSDSALRVTQTVGSRSPPDESSADRQQVFTEAKQLHTGSRLRADRSGEPPPVVTRAISDSRL